MGSKTPSTSTHEANAPPVDERCENLPTMNNLFFFFMLIRFVDRHLLAATGLEKVKYLKGLTRRLGRGLSASN